MFILKPRTHSQYIQYKMIHNFQESNQKAKQII